MHGLRPGLVKLKPAPFKLTYYPSLQIDNASRQINDLSRALHREETCGNLSAVSGRAEFSTYRAGALTAKASLRTVIPGLDSEFIPRFGFNTGVGFLTRVGSITGFGFGLIDLLSWSANKSSERSGTGRISR